VGKLPPFKIIPDGVYVGNAADFYAGNFIAERKIASLQNFVVPERRGKILRGI